MKFIVNIKILSVALATLMLVSFAAPKQAQAQAGDQMLGQLMLVSFGFCPREWINADGQLLPIASYQALYSLYGTMYGGDGRTTFGMPDLRGRYPLHIGAGPGLTPFTSQGVKTGSETATITSSSQLAPHRHNVQATDALANKKGPGLDFLAKVATSDEAIYHDGPPNKTMDPAAITNVGASQPIPQRDPLLVMRWCIATNGLFPSRN